LIILIIFIHIHYKLFFFLSLSVATFVLIISISYYLIIITFDSEEIMILYEVMIPFFNALIQAILFISYDDDSNQIVTFDVITIFYAFFITILNLINQCCLKLDEVGLLTQRFFVCNGFLFYQFNLKIDI
jgi:hypothetical protein